MPVMTLISIAGAGFADQPDDLMPTARLMFLSPTTLSRNWMCSSRTALALPRLDTTPWLRKGWYSRDAVAQDGASVTSAIRRAYVGAFMMSLLKQACKILEMPHPLSLGAEKIHARR